MTTGVNHTPVGIMGSSFFIIRSRSRIILLGFYLEEWMNRNPAVYILASKRNGTLYIGVTSDLMKRVWEHKHDLVEGFTHKYGVHTLVYFEQHDEMVEAIRREKQLKKWNRAWKIELIEKANPDWRNLWQEII
jgi:putative endonuclease